MNALKLINETGYEALQSLAQRSPKLFTVPDIDLLQASMLTEVGTSDVWRQTIVLECSLAPLNGIEEKGPGSDARYSKIIRQALSGIDIADGPDKSLWASINCFAIADYVPIRWETSNIRHSNPEGFVNKHWLKSGSSARQDNAAARLWWLGEISERVSRHSKYSADDLLDAMANNVNLYHQTLSRPRLLANSKLVAVIYESAIEGNAHLYQTKYANAMYKSLNARYNAATLASMNLSELRAVVADAVPAEW